VANTGNLFYSLLNANFELSPILISANLAVRKVLIIGIPENLLIEDIKNDQ